MPRYEITGTATDRFTIADIQEAIKSTGAQAVNRRHAFGMSNQPHVATFTAPDERTARDICDKARALLGPGDLPALLPYEYGSN